MRFSSVATATAPSGKKWEQVFKESPWDDMSGIAATARCKDCGEESFLILREDGSGQSSYREAARVKWKEYPQCGTCGGCLQRDPPRGERPVLIRAEERV